MVKKIVADWSLGNKFRELIVYTYNYSRDEITKYNKQPNQGAIEISKTTCPTMSGSTEVYKLIFKGE